MDSDHYISRKRKLLKDFDKALGHVGVLLVSLYGQDLTEPLVEEARQEYEALMPQLPYLGGAQPFTQFLVSTAWYPAIYRVMQRRGATVEEVGIFTYRVRTPIYRPFLPSCGG